MNRIAFLASIALASTSFAQSTIPEPDLGSLSGTLVSALASKQWALVVAAVLLGGVWLLRNMGSKWIPWLSTPRGGAILATVGGTLALVVPVLAAGQPLSIGLVIGALSTALSASGLWSVGKNLSTPSGGTMAPEVCSAADIANGKPGCPR